MAAAAFQRVPWRYFARSSAILVSLCALLVLSSPAYAQILPGDFDGDGSIGLSDEPIAESLYGSVEGDPDYDAAGDLNGDGAIDHRDLALYGRDYGSSGGATDSTAPGLFVTLNDIPDDMNDLLVAPPELFRVTLYFDSTDGSVIDPDSLSVLNSQDVGLDPAGSELAGQFGSSRTRSVFEVPAATALALATHSLDVRISDSAGNEASATYGFAVRNFSAGPPLGNTQQIFLDFDQDRSLGPEIDVVEDLRTYGLSSATAPTIEQQMRDWVVAEILERVRSFYGIDPDGSPGPDAVDIVFSDVDPGVAHTRICVGGQSGMGGGFLGASVLDVNNAGEATDECALGGGFGVFPQAIDNLWGGDPSYQAAFAPLDPGLGGTAVGDHPADSAILAPGFDPLAASAIQLLRWLDVQDGVNAFSQVVATVTAHEIGHVLGLVAHGPAPGGLWGGDTGQLEDHNVTPGGTNPVENFVMNQGGNFSFDEISGRNGVPLAVFRPLAWAYLHNRIVLNSQVTALLPPPELTSAAPNPVDFAGGGQTRPVTFSGSNFSATPSVVLIGQSDPVPRQVGGETFVDSNTIDAIINKFAVPANTYDVHLINPDGQVSVLIDGLVVQ